MRKIVFAAGAAIGYVLGTRAGRQRYEQMAGAARQVAAQPTVKQAISEVQTQATRMYDAAKTAVNDRLGSGKQDLDSPVNGRTKTLPADTLPATGETTVPTPLA